MGYDVKLLHLYRSASNGIQEGESGLEADENETFISLDYFDKLKIEDIQFSDKFLADSMGLKVEKSMDSAISSQTYCIYASEEQIEKCRTGENDYQDIFQKDEDCPFVSIIQVTINPRIYGCCELNAEFEGGIILKECFEDLNEIMKGTIRSGQGSKYMIYNLLSSGDFAVIIKSSSLEESFEISTKIRNVVVEVNREKIPPYHTYTILVTDFYFFRKMDNKGTSRILSWENCVVVRGAYKDAYWSKREQFVEEAKRRELIAGADGKYYNDGKIDVHKLHGRYDFTLRLTLEEFCRVGTAIQSYKKDGRLAKEFLENVGDSQAVKWLRLLMEKQLILYMNERVFLKYSITDMAYKVSNLQVKKDYRGSNPLDINDFLEIKNAFDALQNDLIEITCVRQEYDDVQEHLRLLERLLQVCNDVWYLPELRISALMLLEHIHVLIVSLQRYIGAYKRTSSRELYGRIKKYLHISVYNLDKFSHYIRNINFQTLQAPNYEIQTTVSVEKILVAYSEFLRAFTECYREKSGEIRCFLPLLVPDIKSDDIQLTAICRDDYIENWQEGKNENCGNSGSCYCNKRLIIINIPTMVQLAETETTISILFHELAHQFRYIGMERAARNSEVTEIVVQRISMFLVRKLFRLDESDMQLFDMRFFFHALTGIYQEVIFRTISEVVGQNDAYMMAYCRILGESMEKLFSESLSDKETFGKDYDIDTSLKDYIHAIRCYLTGKMIDEVEKLADYDIWYKEQRDKIKEMSYKEFVQKKKVMDEESAKKCKQAICTLGKLQEMVIKEQIEKLQANEKIKNEKLKELIDELGTKRKKSYYIEMSEQIMECRRVMDDVAEDESVSQEIGRVLSIIEEVRFLTREMMVRLFPKNNLPEKIYFVTLREKMIEELYEESCVLVKEMILGQNEMAPCNTALNRLIRQFGLEDSGIENNRRAFKNNICPIFAEIDSKGITSKIIGLYREIKSDAFMCRAMNINERGYLSIIAKRIGDLSSASVLRVKLVLMALYDIRYGETGESEQEKLDMIYQSVFEQEYENMRLIIKEAKESGFQDVNGKLAGIESQIYNKDKNKISECWKWLLECLKEHADIKEKIECQIKLFKNISRILSEILKDKGIAKEDMIYEDLMGMYSYLKKDTADKEPGWRWENQEKEFRKIMAEKEDSLNGLTREKEKKYAEQQIQFILRNYYKNRKRYGRLHKGEEGDSSAESNHVCV